jgi:hypothetical protein
MEYLLGSLITLATMFLMGNKLMQKIPKLKLKPFIYSQSTLFEMIKHSVPENPTFPINSNTQSYANLRSKMLKILFVDNQAYWIKDNAVYSADIVDGQIEKDNAKVLDIMTMDDIQLKKIEFIVSKLTEGLANDSGNSGNK